MRAKTALKYGSETWVLNSRYKERLEAVQMRCLKPLLRYTELDRQTAVDVRELFKV
jgi:hypothetical protein